MRRLPLLLAGVGLAGALAVPTLLAPTAATSATGIGAFTGDARAHLTRLTLDAPGATPLGTLVEVTVPEAQTSATSGGSNAFSSLGYPGPVLSNIPQILATSITVPDGIPPYPLQANAQNTGPTDVDDTTSVPGGRMHATATEAGAIAQTDYPSAGTNAALSIGSGQAKAATTPTDVLTSTAHAHLTDVNLLAGLVKIGGITSDASGVSDGSTANGDAKTIVTGATFLDMPATIGTDGVTLGTTSAALAPLKAAVDAAGGPDGLLAQYGISIRVGDTTKLMAKGVGTFGTGGVTVAVNTPLDTSALSTVVGALPIPRISQSPVQVADAVAILGSNQIRSFSLGEAVVHVSAQPPREAPVIDVPVDDLPVDTTIPTTTPDPVPTVGSDPVVGDVALAPVIGSSTPTTSSAIGAPRTPAATTLPAVNASVEPAALPDAPASAAIGAIVLALLAGIALLRIPGRILLPGGPVECAADHITPLAGTTNGAGS